MVKSYNNNDKGTDKVQKRLNKHGIFLKSRECNDSKYDILSVSPEHHTKTETKTEYRKDYTCGIFLKRIEFKDIKNNTFKDLQGSSRIFKDLQGPSRIFKDLQGSSRIFKDLQGPSRTFKELQGPSRAFKGPQGTSRTLKDLQGPSRTFKDSQGL